MVWTITETTNRHTTKINPHRGKNKSKVTHRRTETYLVTSNSKEPERRQIDEDQSIVLA
jgi:hypothetical protein